MLQDELINYVNTTDDHPLIIAAVVHYQLVIIYPFEEGNTRTTITFCCQFADEIGFPLDRKLFEDNSMYVRTALVAYNAFFSDGTDFSKKEYLRKMAYNALG